ncbi:MAG: pyruvate:ferredoxin (flavodoxin) oxidoreductase [candidate division KSB1 bacterium]|nr:pyruvate:ferredoxin (flavodoxin) oxidoreductase [candidate division KSB1 bacterium]
MGKRIYKTIDGNEAVATVAFKTNEVIAIYPITPSSPMGELSDAWAAARKPNIWGTIPTVIEMQSEGGASGAVHGSLQGGALTTTFTSSQGLLLMIPNMYKIAGELTSTVFHVAARTVATHALSIFCDHSDVMATRQTGFALLASASVQEAMDFALIAQAATLEARVPFLHFFDGFRTSHEVSKIEVLTDDQMRAMLNEELIMEHRMRALSPDHPVLRGSAQNPDVFFQARETINPYYAACPDITQKAMDKFAEITGRRYRLFEYFGAPDAERVVILMASGAETAHETVEHLLNAGEKVGVLKVRLYRPFSTKHFMEALPATVKSIAVLDRTKEPGSVGEPLYLDVVNALREGLEAGLGELKDMPTVVGGRYGLSSKEFTPAMVKAVFDNLNQETPKNHFTVGIFDDVTKTSLEFDPEFSTEADDVYRALFYGLGSDGTVSANKNSIKIIGENTDFWAQGYFVYDSKKAGAVTVSHLRFGPRRIRSTYLISRANFVACHQPSFLERFDMLEHIVEGGTFLLNSPYDPDDVWDHLPREFQEHIINKKLKFYVINAFKVARESGMGGRINTVMQVCFFAISGILPREEAIAQIKQAIRDTYGRKGEEIVQMNLQAVDRALSHLHEVKVPSQITSKIHMRPPVPDQAPEFVKDVTAMMIAGKGDDLPVSKMPVDGTFPTGTAQWEKRNLALEIPVWDPDICIQCGKCAMVCPHATIRIKVYDETYLENAPATFKAVDVRDKEWKGMKYTIQVAPEDCTGCALCVEVCPARNKQEPRLKALNMEPQPPLREQEAENWDFFLSIPELDRRQIKNGTIRQQQVQQPLFEFSGACSGCGETPYVKLMSQLFGDRAIVANATGCSSIYGGNLPTTPWTVNQDGLGPAWSNSLFEDNAEFGLGIRLAVNKQKEVAEYLLKKLSTDIGQELVERILTNEQLDEPSIFEQRQYVAKLKKKLETLKSDDARRLMQLADYLVRKSVWIIGGDGWAYDIGFGGLDHVLASGHDVNILVLDTEVYSNTGGQTSKATPLGAIAKFSAGGKPTPKKDLGLIAMSYGNVYVAAVAMGAKDEHTLKAFLEAEAYRGPSLILAYSHCIAHGYNLRYGLQNQKLAVDSGQWLLYRYHPERARTGENPLILDSRAPKIPIEEYLMKETRFKMLTKINPDEAKKLFSMAQENVIKRYNYYKYLASLKLEEGNGKLERKKLMTPTK